MTETPEITELDKKIAALTIAEAVDSIERWEDYIIEIDALIKLGWRPVAVDVTGKTPEKPKFDPHQSHPRGGTTSIPPFPPPIGVDKSAFKSLD